MDLLRLNYTGKARDNVLQECASASVKVGEGLPFPTISDTVRELNSK